MKDKFEINVDEFGANKPFGITIDGPLKQATLIDSPFLSFSVGQRKVGEFREADGQLQFTGDAQASASVFIDHVFMSYGSKMSELKDERDALAAQRDEGLAREVDLRADLARVQAESERQADMKEKNFWALIDSQTENSSLRSERETLQQCLAEAEKLLRDIENPFGDCKEISELKIREFLANHGCADGEKS